MFSVGPKLLLFSTAVHCRGPAGKNASRRQAGEICRRNTETMFAVRKKLCTMCFDKQCFKFPKQQMLLRGCGRGSGVCGCIEAAGCDSGRVKALQRCSIPSAAWTACISMLTQVSSTGGSWSFITGGLPDASRLFGNAECRKQAAAIA